MNNSDNRFEKGEKKRIAAPSSIGIRARVQKRTKRVSPEAESFVPVETVNSYVYDTAGQIHNRSGNHGFHDFVQLRRCADQQRYGSY